MKKPLLALGLLVLAVGIGFLVAWGLLYTMIAVLPPFRPEDDETLREFIPAALTYLTWGTTTLIVFIVGLRRLRRRTWSHVAPSEALDTR